MRRRTQRVRREKPNYYDALEYDKRVRKVMYSQFFSAFNAIIKEYLQTKQRHSECEDDDNNKKEGKRKKKAKKEEEEDDDLVNNLPPEKQKQCALILDELNRKLQGVTWKPT